ncbi:MAG: hypothetical protein PHI18_10200 [bacterium]|nr:hypothetical protein [bacterium]
MDVAAAGSFRVLVFFFAGGGTVADFLGITAVFASGLRLMGGVGGVEIARFFAGAGVALPVFDCLVAGGRVDGAFSPPGTLVFLAADLVVFPLRELRVTVGCIGFPRQITHGSGKELTVRQAGVAVRVSPEKVMRKPSEVVYFHTASGESAS